MELNWTTVILEIVNFLVLVWILKRFLYRPVLQVIEERRARIEATLAEAAERQEAAERLQAQYENRLAEWQRDKQTAREAFEHEMQQKRAQALEELDKGLAAERQKAEVVEERRLRELEEANERAALELGARFATRLLKGLAGPELEGRILALLSEELGGLPDNERAALRRAAQNGEGSIRVESAHALTAEQRRVLERALQQLLGDSVRCVFGEDPALIAGLRLSLGDWSLATNLRDELEGFVDKARELD